jgi:putative glutamine transport system substrate-binding protein
VRALAILIGCSSLASAATPSEIRARGKLIVSVKNEGAPSPASHKDPAHFLKRNFEVALAHALAKEIVGDPDKLELKLMPRAARLFAVAEDRVDLCISMIAITDERKQQVDFSAPYWESGIALLVPQSSAIAKLDDLAGKKLLAVRQTTNDPSAELVRRARGVTFSVDRVTSFAEAEKRIADGKADGLVSQAANIDAFVKSHPTLKRSPLLVSEQFAVAIKKGNADLLAIVNRTIEKLRESGELVALQKKAGLLSD